MGDVPACMKTAQTAAVKIGISLNGKRLEEYRS